jgi:hypothetical protein
MSIVGKVTVGNQSHNLASFSCLVAQSFPGETARKVVIMADLATTDVFPATARIELVFTQDERQKLQAQWSSDAS